MQQNNLDQLLQEQMNKLIVSDDVNKDDLDKVKVEFYATSEDELIQFRKEYIGSKLRPIAHSDIYALGDGYFWTFSFDKQVFFKQYKEIVSDIVSNYIKVIEKMTSND